MGLNKDVLRDALITAFEQGLSDPEWTKEDAAQAMADAIDTFVRSADVTGVEVDVVDDSSVHIGTGTQTGPGTLT
jgi:phage baseplate assembly protein W